MAKSTTKILSYSSSSQRIDRFAMGKVSPEQFTVLRFILDRTVAFGEVWAHITKAQFLDPGCEGKQFSEKIIGTGWDMHYPMPTLRLTEDELDDALMALVAANLIHFRRVKKVGREFSLDEMFLEV